MERFAKIIASEALQAKKIDEQNLSFHFQEPIKVVVASNDQDFQNIESGAPEWADATARPEENTVFLKPLKSINADNLAVVFRHELAHILIYHRLQSHRAPRWFEEGMAVLCSGEFEYQRFVLLAQIGLSGNFTPLEQLDDGFPYNSDEARAAYLESESFVSFLMDRLGPENFPKFLDKLAGGEEFYDALREVSGTGFQNLEKDWEHQVRHRYGMIAVLGGSTSLWFLITLLFLTAYLTRRRRMSKQRKLEELDSGFFPPSSYNDEGMDEDEDSEDEEEITWH